MNILIVDDEKEINDLLELYLKSEGYTIYKAFTGEEALFLVQNHKIDLALLDIMLPDIDGLKVCAKIREKYTFPILMVTAKVQDIDKIKGLSLGADDYITKPFQPLEVTARVKAHLRRYLDYNDHKQENGIVYYKNLIVNPQNHTVIYNDQKLPLTPLEFSILLYLLERKGKVIPAEELFREVWKEEYVEGCHNTVMVHIRHIREKMKDQKGDYIKTVWGVGYQIEN